MLIALVAGSAAISPVASQNGAPLTQHNAALVEEVLAVFAIIGSPGSASMAGAAVTCLPAGKARGQAVGAQWYTVSLTRNFMFRCNNK